VKINLAKSAGFCLGVKRAINLALETARKEKNVYTLGDIVHNETVARQLEESGIKKIKNFGSGKNKIFLIRAHGISRDLYKKAQGLGYKIIDATCPMVKEIHNIAQGMEAECRKIIVIGDKQHDEVKGIIGQLKNKAIIIDNLKNIPLEIIKNLPKAAVVVQSTQNLQMVEKIVAVLKKDIKDLKFFNTICRPTRMKQREIMLMPRANDVMIIIGSKNSANTKRLYEIAKALNKRSYWVSKKADIKRKWFNGAKCVGITAGASTPNSVTQGIISYIKQPN
jgi:4-hydroxy-3-methylbut-2-enyl diphosphate reductase